MRSDIAPSPEPRVLIVDDEPAIRELFEITLGRMRIDTRAAADLASARGLLEGTAFDLCLTDLNLPDGSGLELVRLLAREYPGTPVAVITAYGSIDIAIEALKAGAFDFVQKPVDLGELRALVSNALRLQAPVPTTPGDEASLLVGDSPPMQALRERIVRVARSQAPVHISGESGAGKELAARAIHALGPRAAAPFIPVNCGAIPGELVESELFGHVRGSFTGAVGDRTGLFQAAAGGTLFLDEVADLPLSVQVKLLRVIQERAVRPVGTTTEVPVDVRIISATHADLGAEVAAGRFRQDLFYRLNVIGLPVPSLRERPGDIPALVSHLLARMAERYGIATPALTSEAMTALQQHPFPGNVRELENLLERALTLCENGRIMVADLDLPNASTVAEPGGRWDRPGAHSHQSAERADPAGWMDAAEVVDATQAASLHTMGAELPPGKSLEAHLSDIERSIILTALEANRWNRTAAARQLGITFRALRYRLKKLGLD